MSFIFISYSRQDQAYVDRLVQALTQRNLPVWLDNEINHGQAWNRVIKEQLDQCQVFLLVMSPRAEQSPWVRNEMLYAINKRKTIFPLLLEGEHWFDVLSWQGADVTDGTLPQERFFEDVGSHFPNSGATAESLPVQTVVEGKISPVPAPSVRTAKPTTPATQAVELKSEKGIDYTNLQDLLKAGEWKAADQETADQMLKAMAKAHWSKVSGKDLVNFPCADLKTIDQLWVKYSNGKWGFSVQKQIYVECGAKLDGQYPGDEIWREFCRRVGWRKGESYLKYSDLTFELQNSSTGEFPLGLAGLGWVCSSLASRLVDCSR